MKAANVNKEKDNSSNNNDDDDNDDDDLNNELSNMSIDTSRSGSSNRNCLYCLKVVEGSMRCSKCRTALYCNRECQLKHWPVHKNICQDSNNAENNDDRKLYMKAQNHLSQGNSMQLYVYIKGYYY